MSETAEDWHAPPKDTALCECGHPHLWWSVRLKRWHTMDLCDHDDGRDDVCPCYTFRPMTAPVALPSEAPSDD